MRRSLLLSAAALSFIALNAGAADDMAGMKMDSGGASSTQSYQQDMMTMHKAMDIHYSGDADVDFARGMIPHHQGAIDMAKTELRYGHDPKIRELAEGVIAAQEKEIAFMKSWLAAHPPSDAPPAK